MKNDKQRADEAFEKYFALGPDRSLQLLATRHKYSIHTLKDWSQRHNWQGRLMARLQEAEEESQRTAIKDIVKQRPQYAIGIHNGIARFLQKLQAGTVEIRNFEELDKAMKNLRLELGEPSDRTQTAANVEVSSGEEDTSLLDTAREIGPEAVKLLYEIVSRLAEKRNASE